jgi:hypothetical protein
MPLLVEGQQGSGKSFLCEIAKRIIDPNTALRARLPDTERDLMVLANATFLPVFDNASWVSNRTSDALCTLSTGGGFITRKLRTDDELTMFSMSRPFIINGIGDFANRSDLLERAIPLQLPAIDESERKTEDELRRDFEARLPGILGVLYDIVAVVLAHEADAVPPTGIRMADCAKWLVAAQQAETLKSYDLLTYLAAAQNEFSLDRVMSNSITSGLLDLIENGPVEGTASELRESMIGKGHARDSAYFPKSALKLSSELKRLQPDLKKAGIFVEFGQRTNDRRPIRIWRDGQDAAKPTTPERKF